MSKLYRFDADGWYVGWIVADQPAEYYAARTDLTDQEPQPAAAGFRNRWVNGAWQHLADPALTISLDEAKAARWVQMKDARRNAICSPLATPYGTFDADDDARTNIVQTAHLMQTEAQALAPGQDPTVDFTLADNSVVTLTAAQMVDVALRLASQVQAAYTRGREVRSAIEAATTADEVAAVSWAS